MTRRFIGRIFVVCSFCLGCYSPAFGQAMVEAKKDGVKVLSEPSPSGSALKTLKKGETVSSLERKGMYWEVQSDGKTGYVSVMDVQRHAGGDSAFSSAIKAAAQDSRDMDDTKNTRSRTAIMGVRGLDESKDSGSAGSVKPNMRMVYNMEDRVVSKQALDKLGDEVQDEVKKKMKDKK